MSYNKPSQQSKFTSSYNQSSNSKQIVNSKQKLIQDQNYSTQTFMGLMSTLQSLILQHQNQHQSQYNNKMFKHYDRVNYSSKSIPELKSQLKTHILLFQASRKIFAQEHPNQKWTLPSNFDKQHVTKFLRDAQEILRKNNDQDSFYMIKDIESMLSGKLNNLHSEKLNLKVNYSSQEMASFKNNLLSNSMYSQDQMNKRQVEARNYNDVGDIKAQLNPNSGYYANYQNNFSNQLGYSQDPYQKSQNAKYHKKY